MIAGSQQVCVHFTSPVLHAAINTQYKWNNTHSCLNMHWRSQTCSFSFFKAKQSYINSLCLSLLHTCCGYTAYIRAQGSCSVLGKSVFDHPSCRSTVRMWRVNSSADGMCSPFFHYRLPQIYTQMCVGLGKHLKNGPHCQHRFDQSLN